jgi:ParB family chromosome partitioning protein
MSGILLMLLPFALLGMALPSPSGNGASKVPISSVIPDPAQPRKHFDSEAIDRLAANIAAIGQQQPIVTRWDEALQKEVIVMGNRRWLAMTKLKCTHINRILVEGELKDELRIAMQVSENEMREGFAIGELARAIEYLKSCGWTAKQMRVKHGWDKTRISRAESYLRVAEPIQKFCDDKKIPESSVYDIARHPDPDSQLEYAKALAEKRMTRDEVTAAVHAAIGKRAKKPKCHKITFQANGICWTATSQQPHSQESLTASLPELGERINEAFKGNGLNGVS